MDTNTFRTEGHKFIDWIADYYENIEQYPVKSRVAPGDIKSALPTHAPEKGEAIDAIFEDFQQILIPGISHWQHPGWFAYFPSNSSPASVLGEILTAGLGIQGMIWETSPAATELEEVVMHWLRDMIGLPETFTGVIQDTASTATLCALLSAREKKSGFTVNARGFQETMTVYTSAHTHSSLEKGMKIAGFGKENLRYIETDENYALIPSLLKQAIEQDIQNGLVPCLVAGTLGSTSSMAMDPVKEMGEICKEYNIWFHIDTAFAGTAAIVPEYRAFMEGADMADSLVFNPHKWMLTNFDCSAYFVKDTEILKRTLSITPEYLKTKADDQVNNYRDWGIQLGRRFRALKLWFVIRHYGVEGLRTMIKHHVTLTRQFADWVEQSGHFELMAPVNLTLVCFRYNPGNIAEDGLNRINEQLLQAINQAPELYLTHTVLNGQYCLRMSIAHQRVMLRHVEKAWDIIQTKATETNLRQKHGFVR